MSKHIFILTLSLFFLEDYSHFKVHANEPAPEAHGASGAEHAEAGSEGHGEGHGEKSEEGATKGKKKLGVSEWVRVNNNINLLSAKLKNEEADLADLIEKSKKEKDKARARQLWDEIKEKNKDLKKTAKDYNMYTNKARFEFPDKGVEYDKKYRPYRPKSIEELQNEAGLEGKLTRGVMKMQQVYRGARKKSDEEVTPTPKPSPADNRPLLHF